MAVLNPTDTGTLAINPIKSVNIRTKIVAQPNNTIYNTASPRGGMNASGNGTIGNWTQVDLLHRVQSG